VAAVAVVAENHLLACIIRLAGQEEFQTRAAMAAQAGLVARLGWQALPRLAVAVVRVGDR
jgi:hypothetical protein